MKLVTVFANSDRAQQPTELSPEAPARPAATPSVSVLSWPGMPAPESNPDAWKEKLPKPKILVAEDDAISRTLICTWLKKWGYEVLATSDGLEAMTALRQQDAPTLAILDWMMPGMDGIEICRRTRDANRPLYVLMLTARGTKENLIEGLTAGADDYLVKPFEHEELRARLSVGLRVMGLQTALRERVKQLEAAHAQIHQLKGESGL